MRPCPSFTDFYRALYGRDPFPWQEALAGRVITEGWPSTIGVPTGLGKTTCLAIAVWTLASQAERAPSERTLPTRIWYVVNRRLLVDAGSDHAADLAEQLAQATDGPIAGVADRLRLIGGGSTIAGDIEARPLFVSRMRGGAALGQRPPHAAFPSILLATVPMFASRLLFRGYGATNRMWPIDAALAGTDSLLLLDEAHLARPLQELLGVIPSCDADKAGALRVPYEGRALDGGHHPSPILPAARARPLLVNLTATGDTTGDRFDLTPDDLGHDVVRARLNAAKPTTLVSTTSKALVRDLVSSAVRELDESPATMVIFVNSPRTAVGVRHELTKKTVRKEPQPEIVVLTGQLRELEAERVREHLLSPETGAPSGHRGLSMRARPLVVIATQTLEVGADLDFDVLITESAGVRAMTQRFGRLNRLGLHPGARALVVHPTDRGADGLYGEEPDQVWERLEALDQPLDASPGVIADTFGEPADEPPPMAELLPIHLWEFAKTSFPPSDAAPPEVFFDGLPEAERKISVCWRVELPPSTELEKAVVPSVAAGELVDVPIGELRTLLVDKTPTNETGRGVRTARLMSLDGGSSRPLRAKVDFDRLRPGQRVVMPVEFSGYTSSGWDPAADAEDLLLDVSALYSRSLRAVPDMVEHLLRRPLAEAERATVRRLEISDEDHESGDSIEPEEEAAIASLIIDLLAASDPPETIVAGRWRFDAASAPRFEPRAENEVPLLTWTLPDTRQAMVLVDALDELSIARTEGLEPHLVDVGDWSARLAELVGVPPSVADAVACAGRFHDLGKADVRFQDMLRGGLESVWDESMAEPDATQLRAKSGMTPSSWRRAAARSAWPSGGRHELLSVQMLDASTAAGQTIDDYELVRHLVLAHHGHARPSCPVSRKGGPARTSLSMHGLEICATTDPSCEDWSQPERFRALNERFGYWGLALLETLVRQADHLVSAGSTSNRTQTMEVQ